jgi:ABC-type dipeptide/oligopeptide/nickel transport system ATPase component
VIKKSILEIQNLSITFAQDRRKVEAVRNLSLTVEEKSFTCVVGESGSGKTVTALSVTRLAPQAVISGDILWHRNADTVNLAKVPEKEMICFRGREISYVFQDPGSSLNPLIRIGDQIAETYLAHFSVTAAEAKKETLAQLASVQLKDPERVYRAFPYELSGGMNQRSMIAMALVAKPKLLIADEPTTSLDVTVEREILNLFEILRRSRELTILFITHNLALAASYADVIYVLKKGEVMERAERSEQGFCMKSSYGQMLFRAGLVGVKPKTFIPIESHAS